MKHRSLEAIVEELASQGIDFCEVVRNSCNATHPDYSAEFHQALYGLVPEWFDGSGGLFPPVPDGL